MKKILIILITIPLIFGSCEKEDDSPESNNSGNTNPNNSPPGTTGYYVDHIGNNYFEVYKTTNSGNTWSLQGTPQFPNGWDHLDWVD